MSASNSRRRWRPMVNELIATLVALLLAFVIGAILLVVSDPEILARFAYFGSRPGDALGASGDKIARVYGALWRGSLGGWVPFTRTLAQASPLICAGLGIGLAFKAGLFNIGGQGQAIIGGMMAAWVGFSVHLPLPIHLPLAILVGILGGAIWGGIVGVLKAKAGAHEVIVTIMMNYIASNILLWGLSTSFLRNPERTDPVAKVVDWSATFPRLANSQLNLGFFLALLTAFGVWWLLERTALGLQIKAVGANPDASATAGMSVSRVTIITMAISGGLAGLAGVQVSLGAMSGDTPTPLSDGIMGSIGFDAITVALLGRSRPLGTVFAGLLFGAMHAGGRLMQTEGAPTELATVLQALVVMFVAAPLLMRQILPFLNERRRRTPGVPAESGALA